MYFQCKHSFSLFFSLNGYRERLLLCWTKEIDGEFTFSVLFKKVFSVLPFHRMDEGQMLMEESLFCIWALVFNVTSKKGFVRSECFNTYATMFLLRCLSPLSQMTICHLSEKVYYITRHLICKSELSTGSA